MLLFINHKYHISSGDSTTKCLVKVRPPHPYLTNHRPPLKPIPGNSANLGGSANTTCNHEKVMSSVTNLNRFLLKKHQIKKK